MKQKSDTNKLIELTKRHNWVMDNENIIIQIYVNGSGFLWQLSKLDSGTDLGWSEYGGDCELSGAFTSYCNAIENALDLVKKCSLKDFQKNTVQSKFHWGNYADYLRSLK